MQIIKQTSTMGALRYLIFLKFIIHIEAIKSKSVNLELETVLQFDKKDNAADIKFLDSVQEFLDKVKDVVHTNKTRRFHHEHTNMNFTDFIKSAIDVLKTYDDEDLEDAFAVFDDEIRKYHYKGCKFYELFEDQSVRRFVANKLDGVKEKPAAQLRKNLDDVVQVLEDSRYNRMQAEFLEYVNSLYRRDASDKFKAFLENLQTYKSKSKRDNLNLIKVVRDGIRSTIFNHYSALNANARRDLKIKFETSWSNAKYPEKVERNIWTVQYRNFDKKKYIKNELTTESFSTNTERTEYKWTDHKSADRKEVYFKDNFYIYGKDEVGEKSTSNRKQKERNSELDSEERLTTYRYRPKKRKEETRVTKAKTHKHRNKKISTFITLYPEEITYNTKKRFLVESTTRKAGLFTLWEENIKHHKISKTKNKKHSRNNIYLKSNDDPKYIADLDTIINVNRAVDSSEDKSNEQKRSHIKYRDTEPTKSWYMMDTTKTKYFETTPKMFRKPLPRPTTLEDGMSIESFEIKRRNMGEKNELNEHALKRINGYKPITVEEGISFENLENKGLNMKEQDKILAQNEFNNDRLKRIDNLKPIEEGISIESFKIKRQNMTNNTNTANNELKYNVLRRINNLEKELEAFKSKIDTKLITVAGTSTGFDLLDFWESTAGSSTTTNKPITRLNNVSSQVVTNNVTKTTIAVTKSSNISTIISTTAAINTNKSTKQKNVSKAKMKKRLRKTTRKTNTTFLKTTERTTANINISIPEANATVNPLVVNDMGIDLDDDIDKIMRKYNISVSDKDKPFNFDKILVESEKQEDKVSEIKNLKEVDLEKILGEKDKTNDWKKQEEPLRDINAVLNFLD